jgi:hypothetical protein
MQVGDSNIEVAGMVPLSTYRLPIMNAIPEEFTIPTLRALWGQAAVLEKRLERVPFPNWATSLLIIGLQNSLSSTSF